MNAFLLGDVVGQLRAEGIANACPNRIHYLIQLGRLPRPPLDSRHSFVFSQAHIDRLRVLLAELPSARRQSPFGAGVSSPMA